MAIEIVEFPIKNGGSFHSYVAVYQRVDHLICLWYGDPIPEDPIFNKMEVSWGFL